MATKYFKKEFLQAYEKKTIEHWWSVYPKIISELDIKDKSIVDIGCGNGSFTKALIEYGAKKVVGVDISDKWINFLKKKFSSIKGLNFYLRDAAKLVGLKDNSFDIAIINFVLLHINQKQKVKQIFNEVHRVLKKGGIFVLSEVHPLTLLKNSHIRKTINFTYKDGAPYQTRVKLFDGHWIEFSNHCWTLEFITNLLHNMGFYIQKILEPKYNKKALKIFRDLETPQYIIIISKKIK